MYQFSFYTSPVEPGAAGHRNKEALDLERLHNLITGLTYQPIIENIRKVQGKVHQDKLKKQLPYFTVSGVFAPGTRKAETIKSHSGLMQVDIDAKDNPGKSCDAIKMQIAEDPHLAMIFLSPSGSGVKAIAKIPADVNRHKKSFAVLEAHF